MGVGDRGRRAVTDLEVIERLGNATVVNVTLRTGRTHQIRVHLAYIKRPIVGDPVYGRRGDPFVGRPALHAIELKLLHPGDGSERTFRSRLPADLRELVVKGNIQAGVPTPPKRRSGVNHGCSHATA